MFFLFYDIVIGSRHNKVQRIAKISSLNNLGEILVRLYSLGEVLDLRPSATSAYIFIQICRLVRTISIH